MSRLIAALLLGCAAGAASAAEVCPGLSSETARRIFEIAQRETPTGYQLDGVGTDRAQTQIQWSHDGTACPVVRVEVINCDSPSGPATLVVRTSEDGAEGCPALRSVVPHLSTALSQLRPSGEDDTLRRQMLPSYLALLVMLVAVLATIIVVLVLAWADSRRGVRGRWLRAVLLSLAVLAGSEIGYRVLVRVMEGGASTDTFEIYGVGESTMVGEPFEDQFSLPRLVSELLGRQVGDRRIVIRLVAERGAGAFAQAVRFEREMLHRDRSLPGVALIYSGHNEPYLDPNEIRAAPSLWSRVEGRTRAAIAGSWLVRDALSDLRSLRVVKPAAGMARYEQSLRRIIESARDGGLVPILFTLPSNIAGIEPNAYVDGVAGDQQNSSAELLLYDTAKAKRAAGELDQARSDFWTVVDHDRRLNFGRATTVQNALIRELAAEYRIPLVDALVVFEQAAADHILDSALFSDGHHPNLAGYDLLAWSAARRLAEVSGVDFKNSGTSRMTDSLAGSLVRDDDLRRAHIASGSWLISTAAYHPAPHDRLRLAEDHFRAALGGGDDFSAWLGLAVVQAAGRGFLRDKSNLDLLARAEVYYRKSFSVPASERAALAGALRAAGADSVVLSHVQERWR